MRSIITRDRSREYRVDLKVIKSKLNNLCADNLSKKNIL